LELSFLNIELRHICEDESVAIKEFGPEIALQLQRRLVDLDVAKYVAELPVGNPGKLGGERYKVDVLGNVRIIFSPNPIKIPRDANRQVDWSRVSRIKILEIGINNE
jgi:hypothetical protein